MATRTTRAMRCALIVLACAAAACGNDEPETTTPSPAPVAAVAFQPAVHLRVDDVSEIGRPRIAAGRPGTWLVVYATADGFVVLRSSVDGASFGDRVVVDVGAYRSSVEVACDRAGGCVAVWQVYDIDDVIIEVWAACSADDGATWRAPASLGVPNAHNDAPQIATDGRGTWMMAWGTTSIPGLLTATSHDGGCTWDAPVALAPRDEVGYWPKLAADATGRWVAVWTSADLAFPFSRTSLRAAVSTDAGRTWSAPIAVTDVATAETPQIVVQGFVTDGAGSWIASGVVEHPDEGGSGRYQGVFAVRSIDGGLSWGTPVQLDAPAASKVELFPRIGADAEGRVVVGWLEYAQANQLVMFAAQSVDRGATWLAQASFPGSADPTIEGFPDLGFASDHRGAWLAVWKLAIPDRPSLTGPHDVVVARGSSAGPRD
jgi:hypothetical protein